MKLITFRCEDVTCGYEEEDLLEPDQLTEDYIKECPKCKKRLYVFNFKNNRHRWRYIDQ